MMLENKLKASKCSWAEGRLKRTQTDIHGASPSLPSHECHGHRRINKHLASQIQGSLAQNEHNK